MNSARWLGPLLVLTSALLFSLSGVLTKAIDAGAWTILTWRGLIGGLGIGAYVAFRRRHVGIRGAFRLGRHGWLIATVGAIGSVTFIVSFKNTFVANVSVIYALIPFVAALLERLFLGVRAAPRTIFAGTASLTGVLVIVAGSLGTPNLGGDAVALLMAILNALYMVLIRAFPEEDSVLAGAVGGPMLFVAGWFATDPLDVDMDDAVLLLAFGLVFAAATVCWIEGTRRISAAESGLLGTAETPIAIALAWIILAEAPALTSGIGAAVVLAAVIGHAWPEPETPGRLTGRETPGEGSRRGKASMMPDATRSRSRRRSVHR